MELLGRVLKQKNGQGLVEYSVIMLLVVFIFWLAVKNTNIGNQISASWTNISSCLAAPFACLSS
jgi:Flp pilus assembly pilin Flp